MLWFGLKGFGLYSKLKSSAMFLNEIPWIFPSFFTILKQLFQENYLQYFRFPKESILKYIVAHTEVENVLDETPNISLELDNVLEIKQMKVLLG